MKRNVGGIDRAFRAFFGLAVIAVGVYFKSWWAALGAIPLLTAAFQWCPTYAPFGMSTYKGTRIVTAADTAGRRA